MWLLTVALASGAETLSTAALIDAAEDADIEVLGVWGQPERAELRQEPYSGDVVVVTGASGLEAHLEDSGQDCGWLVRRPTQGSWTYSEVCVAPEPAPSPAVITQSGGDGDLDTEEMVNELIAEVLSEEVGSSASSTPQPTSSTPGTGPSSALEPLVEELLSQKDHAARRARLLELLQDPDASAADLERYSAALAVVGALQEQERDDAFVTRLFLQAALSQDAGVRGQAVEAARAGGDPPMGTVAAPVEPEVVAAPVVEKVAPSPAKLREYQRRRLTRGTKVTVTKVTTVNQVNGVATPSTSTSTRTGWTVYDGQGTPMSSTELLRRAGESTAGLQADKRRVTRISWAVTGLGLAVCGTSAARYSAGMNEPIGPKHDLAMGVASAGIVLGGAAVFAGPVASLLKGGSKEDPGQYFTVSEADRLIDKANARLRRELGLSEEDTAELDLR